MSRPRTKKPPPTASGRKQFLPWSIFIGGCVLALLLPVFLISIATDSGTTQGSDSGLRIEKLGMSGVISSLRRSPSVRILNESLDAVLVEKNGQLEWESLVPGAVPITPPAFLVWSERDPSARLALVIVDESRYAEAWRSADQRIIHQQDGGVVITMVSTSGDVQRDWLVPPEQGRMR